LPRNSALRQPRDRPDLHFTCGPNPLSGFDSTLRVSPIRHHHGTPSRALLRTNGPFAFRPLAAHSPFRGFVPYSVLPTAWSHRPPTCSHTLVPLRPQGFTPSRRFAPHTIFRAYFIPIPLMGFTLRGFAPRAVPHALSDAESLRISETASLEDRSPSVQGLTHRPEPKPPVLGISQDTTLVPPWAFSLRGFLS
jgi:hypothetical protein